MLTIHLYQGGISNGEPIVFRVAFKPPATIGQAQHTANFAGERDTLAARGRHDPCVVPRAVPIVEVISFSLTLFLSPLSPLPTCCPLHVVAGVDYSWLPF